MNTKTKNPGKAFFTIDVERFSDTECIYKSEVPVKQTMLDGLDRYMEILNNHNIKATLFVLTDFADEIANGLKKHLANGHKIALHGERHIPPKLLSDNEFESQITRAKSKLEDMLDTRVIGYRAPCFGIDRQKLDILQKSGFLYDSSLMGFSKARHNTEIDMSDFKKISTSTFEKNGFFEFAMSTEKIFGFNFPVSGGGYVRISNWLFTRFMLKKHFIRSDDYVFYSHPFEFSKEKLPKIKTLKSYDKYYLQRGLSSYVKKLEFIIKQLQKNGYNFSTFEDEIQKSNGVIYK